MAPSFSWNKLKLLTVPVLAVTGASGTTTTSDGPSPTEAVVGGACTFVNTVFGIEKEELQDRLSVQTQDDVPVSFDNMASYVRMLTIFGDARTDFYFTPPPELVDGTASTLTVEVSALVPEDNTGGVWTVGIDNGSGSNDTFPLGNLAPAHSTNWTTVYLTVPITPDVATGSLGNYLGGENNEVLLTVTCDEPGSTQVIFIDYMTITATGGGPYQPATLASSPTGTCTFVDTIVGVEKEELQDRESVHTNDDLLVSFENRANYVRMLTIFGDAQTRFYFSPPSFIADGTATTLAVEVSALVPTEGSGAVWTVGIDKDGVTYPIGDLAPAGSTNWTTVHLTAPLDADDAAGYVDGNNEVLLTVSCDEPGSTQVLFIDFMEITAD